MTFTEKLIEYRTQTKTPINVMSEHLNVSVPTYRKIESNPAYAPTRDILAKLESATNISTYVWADPNAKLPDLENRVSNRGRKPLVITPNDLEINRRRLGRVQTVINSLFEGNRRSFAAASMTDEARLSKMLSSKIRISPRFLQIVAGSTGVSLEWLEEGHGPMLQKDRPATTLTSKSESEEYHNGNQLDRYLKSRNLNYTYLQNAMHQAALSSATAYKNRKFLRPDTQQRIADALKVPVSDIFPPIGGQLKGPIFAEDIEMIEIPYLPEAARAGLDTERYFEQPLQKVSIRKDIIPENLRNRRWWQIEVNGDSMEPLLIHGDEVTAYEQRYDEWATLNNRVIVVQYAAHVVIKRIKKNTLMQEQGLWLHSDNPASETFFVRAEDIQMIWLVESRTGKIR